MAFVSCDNARAIVVSTSHIALMLKNDNIWDEKLAARLSELDTLSGEVNALGLP